MTLAAICRSHVRRLGNNRGLTLIELLAVMAVIGLLAAIAVLIYANFDNQARIARACADIAILSSEISTFETLNERLPNNLAEINRATFLDPWGRPYEYLNLALGPGQERKDLALHPINSDFDLYSKGKDGVSQPPLTAAASRDDIVRANDGQFIGLASTY
jgi:general secretion pathway protein G